MRLSFTYPVPRAADEVFRFLVAASVSEVTEGEWRDGRALVDVEKLRQVFGTFDDEFGRAARPNGATAAGPAKRAPEAASGRGRSQQPFDGVTGATVSWVDRRIDASMAGDKYSGSVRVDCNDVAPGQAALAVRVRVKPRRIGMKLAAMIGDPIAKPVFRHYLRRSVRRSSEHPEFDWARVPVFPLITHSADTWTFKGRLRETPRGGQASLFG